MTYTKTKPSAPGWYWVRGGLFPPQCMEMELDDGAIVGTWIHHSGVAKCGPVSGFGADVEFAGPIPEPVEPGKLHPAINEEQAEAVIEECAELIAEKLILPLVMKQVVKDILKQQGLDKPQ
jgi:hypothetical protein